MSDRRPDDPTEDELEERTGGLPNGGSDPGEAFRRAEEAGELERGEAGTADRSPIDEVFRSGS